MAPADVVDELQQQLQLNASSASGSGSSAALPAGKQANKQAIVVDVNAEAGGEPRTVDRFEPHPLQAAAAPTREQFAAEGPVIATGHPMLDGIQVREFV